MIPIHEKTAFAVFDTETTGLFARTPRGTPPIAADAPGQPRMASFAAILTDDQGVELDRIKAFVRPDGWSMAEEDARAIANGKRPASEINGLTDDFLQSVGVPVLDVLTFWNELIDAGVTAAAFNAQYDTKIMRAEMRRASLDDRFEETRDICLMKGLWPYGPEGMPIMRGFIKLSEACEWFGIVNEDAHDAMGDAVATTEILRRVIADGRVPAVREYRGRGRAA